MKRILPALVLALLAASCNGGSQGSGDLAEVKAQLASLSAEVAALDSQVMAITEWAITGDTIAGTPSVNRMLESVAGINATYVSVCRHMKDEGHVPKDAKCPGDGEPTDPPTGKPPSFNP